MLALTRPVRPVRLVHKALSCERHAHHRSALPDLALATAACASSSVGKGFMPRVPGRTSHPRSSYCAYLRPLHSQYCYSGQPGIVVDPSAIAGT